MGTAVDIANLETIFSSCLNAPQEKRFMFRKSRRSHSIKNGEP